jgi:uncharacterized cupredoxin-like copper-binding protein
MKSRAVLVVALALVALVAACGGGKSTAKVAVGLKEWEVEAQPAEVKPGKVEFTITNNGTRVHQFVVVKSDLPPGQLPTTPDNIADLSKVNVSGSVEAVQPGETATLELDLSPGKYVFICNLLDKPSSGPPDPHYLNGMSAAFFVLDQ